jgi:hypothetical protein
VRSSSSYALSREFVFSLDVISQHTLVIMYSNHDIGLSELL